MHLMCYDIVKRGFASFLFCSSFANRAAISGDLYIDFDRHHSIFPVACLVCQVDALTILFLLEYPYALHIIPCISCHVLHHVSCALHHDWLLFCWVRLRGASFRQPWELCRQDDHYSQYHFYLSLLVVRSIAMSRHLPLVYQASHCAMSSL